MFWNENTLLSLQNKILLQEYIVGYGSLMEAKSKHWVNDRLYPRRPFMYQKRALEIDDSRQRSLQPAVLPL